MTRLEIGADGYSVFASVDAKARQPSTFSTPPADAVAGDLLIQQQGDTAAIFVFIAPDPLLYPDRQPMWAPLHAHVGVAPQTPGAVVPWNSARTYNYPDMVLVGSAATGFVMWIATKAVAAPGAEPGTVAGDGWVAIGSGLPGPTGPSGTMEVDPVLLGMPQDEKDRPFIRTLVEQVSAWAYDARTGTVTTDAAGDFTVQFSRTFLVAPTVICQSVSNAQEVRLVSRGTQTFSGRAFVPATNAVIASTAITLGYIAAGPFDITINANERSFAVGGATPPALLAAPANLRVTSATNDFAGVTLAWNAVAGATDYDLQVLDEAGTVLSTTASAGALTLRVTTPFAADTRYQYRVRTRTATDTSAYSANIRYAIGHARTTGTRDVTKTRPWTSTVSVNCVKDVAVGVITPANVSTSQMVVALVCNFTTGALSGTATRSVHWIQKNLDIGFVGGKPNPWNETIGWPYYASSAGTMAGVVLRGTGWSTSPTGGFRATGTIRVDGTETYTESETYTIVEEQLCAAW